MNAQSFSHNLENSIPASEGNLVRPLKAQICRANITLRRCGTMIASESVA